MNDSSPIQRAMRGVRSQPRWPRMAAVAGVVMFGLLPCGASAAGLVQDQHTVRAPVTPTAISPQQLPVGIGSSALIGIGVEDVGQANAGAAESAVNSETAGYKSCTNGNQKYAQEDVFSHPADPSAQNGQPYPRQYEMHAWLGMCSTETTEGKNGAYVQWNYYYGSDSRYCGGCNYYQIDTVWIEGRAWDCGSQYYDSIASANPGYVTGEQSPYTSAGNDCGAQADLQANWQSTNNWGASAYVNDSGNTSCSPCINLNQSQAKSIGVTAIDTAGARNGLGGFTAVSASRAPSLATFDDLAGYKVFSSTQALDTWTVLATAPSRSGLTNVTGWAVVNARSGAVIAAGEEHQVGGATRAQGNAIHAG